MNPISFALTRVLIVLLFSPAPTADVNLVTSTVSRCILSPFPSVTPPPSFSYCVPRQTPPLNRAFLSPFSSFFLALPVDFFPLLLALDRIGAAYAVGGDAVGHATAALKLVHEVQHEIGDVATLVQCGMR